MIAYDEDVAKGIYNKKCWGIGDKLTLGLFLLPGILLLIGVYWFIFYLLSFGVIDFFYQTSHFGYFFYVLLIIFMVLVFIFCIYSVLSSCIKYYFCEVNCWLGLEKNKLYIIGYLQGKKIEKVVNTRDIKGVEWTWNFFSYKGKNYEVITLITEKGKRIKNIPVEYKSELYNFLKDLNKA